MKNSLIMKQSFRPLPTPPRSHLSPSLQTTPTIATNLTTQEEIRNRISHGQTTATMIRTAVMIRTGARVLTLADVNSVGHKVTLPDVVLNSKRVLPPTMDCCQHHRRQQLTGTLALMWRLPLLRFLTPVPRTTSRQTLQTYLSTSPTMVVRK